MVVQCWRRERGDVVKEAFCGSGIALRESAWGEAVIILSGSASPNPTGPCCARRPVGQVCVLGTWVEHLGDTALPSHTLIGFGPGRQGRTFAAGSSMSYFGGLVYTNAEGAASPFCVHRRSCRHACSPSLFHCGHGPDRSSFGLPEAHRSESRVAFLTCLSERNV